MTERLTPTEWVIKNDPQLHAQLLAFRAWLLAIRREKDPDGNPRFFDKQRRSLSEMPLCKGHQPIAVKTGLPQGFHVVSGHVDTEGVMTGSTRGIPHMFLQSGTDHVVDLTASQFVRGGRKPGDKSEVLKDSVPEHTSMAPSGLLILTGSRKEIREKTGIDYNVHAVIL